MWRRLSARSVGRLVARTLVGVALLLGLAEGTLQLLSLVVRDRSAPWSPGTTRHVLCVGDSHTYGAGVKPEESYPGQLQRFLDEEAPGVYSVVNLGIPGMSTTQILNRLPTHVSRLHPDIVIVLGGLNDSWNEAEVGETRVGWRGWLDGILVHTRLHRLARVWIHDRSLEREGKERGLQDARPTIDSPEGPLARNRTSTVDWGDVVERVEFKERSVGMRPDAEVQARLLRNYEAMAEYAHAAGVRLIFVAYLLDFPHMALPNQAMRSVAQRHGITVVESGKSLDRVPLEQRIWVWGLHPGAPTYREIARDVALAVSHPDTAAQ